MTTILDDVSQASASQHTATGIPVDHSSIEQNTSLSQRTGIYTLFNS